MVVRNGVLRRLEANELNFVTQETKIITDFAPGHTYDERHSKPSDEERGRDVQNVLKGTEQGNTQTLRRSNSIVDEFLGESRETDSVKDDYCRVWYEKLAL